VCSRGGGRLEHAGRRFALLIGLEASAEHNVAHPLEVKPLLFPIQVKKIERFKSM